MDGRGIINSILAVVLGSFSEVLESSKWFIVLAIIVIICDLRFGIMAARKRNEKILLTRELRHEEKIRFSSAVRRTVAKGVNYVLWIMLAVVAGKAFGEPLGISLLPTLMLVIIYGCEINSCFNNYFEAIGKDFTFNIFKLLKRKGVDLAIQKRKKKEDKE